MAKIRPFKASFPELENIPDTNGFFSEAKHLYPEYSARGIFKSDKEESLYIYEQESALGAQTGLIALTDIQDYIDGQIVKHELTLEHKEQIMLNLLDERHAMIKPTLLTYPSIPKISNLLNKLKQKNLPTTSIHFQGAMHRFWKISKPKQIEKLVALFKSELPLTYIGDGHHRAATTAIRYKELKKSNPNHTGNEYYNCLFSVFFADDQLKIFEFNRVVTTLNRFPPKAFKAELRKDFIISKCYAAAIPRSKFEIGMYLSNKWYSLTPKPHLLEKGSLLSDKLAVSIWNREVLNKVLDIKDPRTDSRIQYIEGPKGVDALMKKTGKNSFSVGFTFFPVELEKLMEIADAGETMPPKSTWFTPRMHNGLIVHQF